MCNECNKRFVTRKAMQIDRKDPLFEARLRKLVKFLRNETIPWRDLQVCDCLTAARALCLRKVVACACVRRS